MKNKLIVEFLILVIFKDSHDYFPHINIYFIIIKIIIYLNF
jgi:hypothetical protein